MAQHVQVQVVDRRGQPLNHERVSIFATHIASEGGIPDQETNKEGFADFDLDVEDQAEVIVYVRGRECISRGPLKNKYEVAI